MVLKCLKQVNDKCTIYNNCSTSSDCNRTFVILPLTLIRLILMINNFNVINVVNEIGRLIWIGPNVHFLCSVIIDMPSLVKLFAYSFGASVFYQCYHFIGTIVYVCLFFSNIVFSAKASAWSRPYETEITC